MWLCALFIVQDPSPAQKQIINLLLFFFVCVATRTSGLFFSPNVHHLVSQILMWGMVRLFAMLHIINSEAEVYTPFFQTGTQLIQQHGHPVTFALLKEGRKGSPQPFMTQSFVLKAQTILGKDEGTAEDKQNFIFLVWHKKFCWGSGCDTLVLSSAITAAAPIGLWVHFAPWGPEFSLIQPQKILDSPSGGICRGAGSILRETAVASPGTESHSGPSSVSGRISAESKTCHSLVFSALCWFIGVTNLNICSVAWQEFRINVWMLASFLLWCLAGPHGGEPGVIGKSSGLPSGSPWTGRRWQWRWEGKAAALEAEVGTCIISVGLFKEDYAFS